MQKYKLVEATAEEVVAFDKDLRELLEKHNAELKPLPFVDAERKLDAQLILLKKQEIVEAEKVAEPNTQEGIPSPFNGTEPTDTTAEETA